MASKSEKQIWETFVRRPGELRAGVEMPMVVRDLRPGRSKYRMRHVVAVVSHQGSTTDESDELRVRTVVGVRLPEIYAIKILRKLPVEIPGTPYKDFYEALRRAAGENPV